MLGVYLMPVFREGLARLGWTEGCNLRIDEFRVADAADRRCLCGGTGPPFRRIGPRLTIEFNDRIWRLDILAIPCFYD